MLPKGQGIVYSSRMFVCRSSLRRKSTADLTENENQDCRGEFRFRQTRQLPRAVDLKGRVLFLIVVKC
jgi:hypothetical protein